MKTQTVTPKKDVQLIHVETKLGIVNIYLGLTDERGRAVEAVELIPNNYAGENKVKATARRFIQLKQKQGGNK